MYCYKFPDRATFITLATAEGLVSQDGTLITASHNYAIDEIGPITKGGQWDASGNVVIAPTVITGHHVNVVGIAPEAWDQYLVVVNSASRIFLGGSVTAPSIDVLEEMTA